MNANGPAVCGVPTELWWHAFLQSPVQWAGFSCHDKVVQMAEFW